MMKYYLYCTMYRTKKYKHLMEYDSIVGLTAMIDFYFKNKHNIFNDTNRLRNKYIDKTIIN